MRWTIVLLLLFIPLRIDTTAAKSADQGPRNSKDIGLAVNIAINTREFCSGDDDVYSERLDLTVRYTSKGKSAVTVYIGTDIVQATRVARTIEEMKAGKYELEIGADPLLPMDGGRYMLGSDPEAERLVTLAPGQSVEIKSPDFVPVSKSESKKINGTVTSGRHILVVLMMIKASEVGISKQAADNWNHHPEYPWVTIASQPVEFEVPANPGLLRDCSS
jgi:hypothetical protein